MMRFKISRVVVSALLVSAALFAGCESKQPAATAPASTATPAAAPAAAPTAAPTAEARYECPMNCEGSASTKPGKCPVCKMDLEKKS